MSSKPFTFPSFVLLLLVCTSVLATEFAGLTPKHVGDHTTFVGILGYNPIPGQSREKTITDRAKTLQTELRHSLSIGKNKQPTALSILHTDPSSKELYVASSAKQTKGMQSVGKKYGPYGELETSTGQVGAALEECGGHNQHGNGAHCGEIMATALYEQKNKIPLPEKDKLIVTVQKEKHSEDVKVIPPCGKKGAGTFGCDDFLDRINFDKKKEIISEPECILAQGTSGGKLGKRACAKKPATIKPATQGKQGPKTATVRKTPLNVKPQNAKPPQSTKAPLNAKPPQSTKAPLNAKPSRSAKVASNAKPPRSATNAKPPQSAKAALNARPAQSTKAPTNAKTSQKPGQIQHKTPNKSTRGGGRTKHRRAIRRKEGLN